MTNSGALTTLDDFDAFHAEVRKFCRTELPEEIRAKYRRQQLPNQDDVMGWERKLAQRGWYAAHWPREYGGQGWGRLQRFRFIEALELEGAPWLTPFGIDYVGPVLYTFGNTGQQQRWLPGILNCETFWCQGFSEPGAGSDLAAVRTRARRVNGQFIVSGQKTWTTLAHWADMIFLLVRTSESEQPRDGLSLLLADLQSPGVSVRPIRTLDLEHGVNEVFLDDVAVPFGNLVGTEGQAWQYAKFILANERPFAVELGKAKRRLGELLELSAAGAGSAAVRWPGFARRAAEITVRIHTLEALAHGILRDADDFTGDMADAAMLKLRGSELQQLLGEAEMELLGRLGLPCLTGNPQGHAGMWRELLHGRATTIYGGTSEIQRDILARSALAT